MVGIKLIKVTFIQRLASEFLQAGAGAVVRTAQDKSRDTLTARDYGAVGLGVTDDTASLKALFDYAIPLGLCVTLKGAYKVSGPITTAAEVAAGHLHIHCDGNVEINVAAGSTAFRDLIYCESTAANNGSITGGSLYIDLNNLCACGITIRHNAASQSGVVNISAQVSVLNAKVNDAAATYENQGILVYGDYQKVALNQPLVKGVSRTNATGGACKGISVKAFTGDVVLNQPHVENVLVPIAGSSTDADGIAVFGKLTGSTYSTRPGKVTINDPVFIDCQGRSFKSQCSDVTVFRPRVRRQMVIAIPQACEFDFQFGNGLVIEPDYEYRLNSGVSPIGSGHSCVTFQQVLDDAVMHAKSIGGTLRTEAVIPRYAITIHQATALRSEVEVSGLRVVPIGAFATTAFDRAIIETSGATIVAKTERTKLVVRDITGPIQCYGIGYTGYSSGALTAKLSWSVSDMNNTLGPAATAVAFKSLSGSAIPAVSSFLLRNNAGFRDLMPAGWTFNFTDLVQGCTFTVDLSNVLAIGAPGWGASGFATVECVGGYFAATEKSVRVTKDNAATTNTVFWTRDGGTTWGTIK